MRTRDLAFGLLAMTPMVMPVVAAEVPAPNVVFILADDFGWTDVSGGNTNMGNGSDYYRTPHIDALMAKGMSFDNAYACPNCAPTRATLMSGQYSTRHGMYTVSDPNRGPAELRALNAAENKTEVAPEVVTMAEMFKGAGYDTYHLGKWHLGVDGQGTGPMDQGFDVNFGGTHTGSIRNMFSINGGTYTRLEECVPKNGKDGEFFADRMTDQALTYLEDRTKEGDKDPFFMYLSHYSVHTPISAPKADIENVGDRPVGKRHTHKVYAAMVENLDNNIGRVMDYLEQTDDPRNPGKKMIENTLVVFYGDNGGLGGYKSEGIKWSEVTVQTPLRCGKGSLYEGGMRVPMIVRWDGMVKPNTISSQVMTTADFYKTFIDVAKAKTPEQELDGESLLGILTGKAAKLERDTIYMHFPAYLQGSKKTWRCKPGTTMRQGDWKLIFHYETDEFELYNLAEDIGEKKNLAEKYPDRVVDMAIDMSDWLEDTGALLPRFIDSGMECNLPNNVLY